MDFGSALDTHDRSCILPYVHMDSELLFSHMLTFLSRRQVDRFLLLIEYGFDITFSNKYQETLLHVAAYKGMEDMCILLIRWGLDVNAKNKDSETPLCMACKQRKASIVWLLLRGGADPEPSFEEPLPIDIAYKNRYYDHVRALLSLPLSKVPIHKYVNDPKMLEMCVQRYPFYLNMKDRFGDPLIHRVIERGSPSTLKMLMTYGIDVSMCNYHGETPLEYARAENKKKMIKILESY